ncbi:MAG: uroporphyrinogen-III C-methyltransferase, partial [Deltaproteobacteria bacterium]|nr:uroporphyrinogen-III C-methyltransferase [Deltaproteobacteria bacterium]
SADIIFYDNLVNADMLQWASQHCEKVFVGKRGEGSSSHQAHIEDLIVEAARLGKKVVRLKGGDPFIFGRGGEEAERLAFEKIPFEIVSGVTSAIAAPAYAGIPLTHRDFTQTVTFVTGHAQEKTDEFPQLHWKSLAQLGTLVFVMGVKTIRQNMQHLMEAGLDPATPAALVRWGTYPTQTTYCATVSSIADEVERCQVMPPCVLVVGEVVRLRETIQWFENKPLFNKNVLVTRARPQMSQLSKLLLEKGAQVFEFPTLEIRPPNSWEKFDEVIAQLSQFQSLIFTSSNGVDFFFKRLQELKIDFRKLSQAEFWVVGEWTGKALEKYGFYPDLIPETANAECLLKSIDEKDLSKKAVLILQVKNGNPLLGQELRKKAKRVEVLEVYENVLPKISIDSLKSNFDFLTFASSSAIENFCKLIPQEKLSTYQKIKTIVIGEKTKASAIALGFESVEVSDQVTVEGMVLKIEDLVHCFINGPSTRASTSGRTEL